MLDYKILRKKTKRIIKGIKPFVMQKFLAFRIGHSLKKDKSPRQFAFFTPLPPAQTGTGMYALKVYQHIFDDLDFVSTLDSYGAYKKTLSFIPKQYQRHIVPLQLASIRKYDHILLNLGNSYFHVPYLKYGVQTKGKPFRHIVLCETQICGMLQHYYKENGVDFLQILHIYYPEKTINPADLQRDFWGTLKRENIFGIRPLMDLTGIHHFILYREVGKDLLLADVKDSPFEKKVQVSLLPMGFEHIQKQPQITHLPEGCYHVGSFGIAGDMKQTDKIIRAVNLLNIKGEKVTLWLAGYSLEPYVGQFNTENLRLVENASYDTVLSLMASVDLAVQLRKFSNGEGSGCIAELIALNKNFIAADNLFEKHFKNTGVSIPSDCTVEELAAKILHELKNKTLRDNSAILKKYTFKNTAESFKELFH